MDAGTTAVVFGIISTYIRHGCIISRKAHVNPAFERDNYINVFFMEKITSYDLCINYDLCMIPSYDLRINYDLLM